MWAGAAALAGWIAAVSRACCFIHTPRSRVSRSRAAPPSTMLSYGTSQTLAPPRRLGRSSRARPQVAVFLGGVATLLLVALKSTQRAGVLTAAAAAVESNQTALESAAAQSNQTAAQKTVNGSALPWLSDDIVGETERSAGDTIIRWSAVHITDVVLIVIVVATVLASCSAYTRAPVAKPWRRRRPRPVPEEATSGDTSDDELRLPSSRHEELLRAELQSDRGRV